MTNLELTTILGKMNHGDVIPGTIAGKSYTFTGLEKYPGRGRFSHLKGQDIIVIMSGERKRSMIKLFVDPLLLFVNAPPEELSFGHLPHEYMRVFNWRNKPKIPNVNEYETHYKSVARHLQRILKQ